MQNKKRQEKRAREKKTSEMPDKRKKTSENKKREGKKKIKKEEKVVQPDKRQSTHRWPWCKTRGEAGLRYHLSAKVSHWFRKNWQYIK